MSVTDEKQAAQAGDAGTALLRIPSDKVNRLMDLVGELSLGVAEVSHQRSDDGMEYNAAMHSLKQVMREVQDAAAELRLVSIGEVFRRLRRMVRELERQTGKKINLVLEGEDTPVDKGVADRLYEPLVHVVRNSADHGLEGVEERLASGKPETGVITLAATQVGSEVQITVKDDGRGLNREKILGIARKRDFFGETEEPEDSALWRVIFEPGFSTAENVTNISGRGVGMDVLNTAMRSLRGRIRVDSELNEGTMVVLSIPVTLSFLDCLVMQHGTCLYATPIDAISEIVRPESDEAVAVSAQGGSEFIKMRGELVPIQRLENFYDDVAPVKTELCEKVIVVFESGIGKFGMPMDEIIGQQQIVMKPMVGPLERVWASWGCALLGSGDVAVVLDCERIAGVRVRKC